MTASSAPPVSVVVCSRERPRLLADAVASILAGTVAPAEVLVIDQSRESHPRLAAGADRRVTYVHTREQGLSRARNLGIATARGAVVAFLDDDEIADPRWLASLLDRLTPEGDRVVLTGQVLSASPERRGAFAPADYLLTVPAVFAGRLDHDPVPGGNMLAWRSALEEVGAFDERLGAGTRFPAADDNDVGLRLLEAGYRVAHVPEAVVYHRAWRPGWGYPALRWRYGRGKGGFYGKHLDKAHMRRRLRSDVGRRLVRLPVTAASQPGRALGDVSYLAGVGVGLVRWLAHGRGRAA